MDTTGAFIDRTKVSCPLPEWGLLYAAATVKFSLYTGDELIEAFGEELRIYLAETIFRVSPNMILSGSTDVVVAGAGFSTDAAARQYRCVLFPLAGTTAWRAVASKAMYPAFARQFPFTPFNATMGACTVSWPFPAAQTRLSIAHLSEPISVMFDRLPEADKALLRSQTPVPQPVILSVSEAGIIRWADLPVSTKEEWYAISETAGHYAGGAKGTKLFIAGHGFRNTFSFPTGHGAFVGAPYLCVFSAPGGYSVTSPAVATPGAGGVGYSSTQLECLSPSWAQPQGRSRFTLRTTGGEQLAETAGYEHAFSFIDVPVWGPETPPEGFVVIDGVHCSQTHRFVASGGRAPLRLSLDYTALRPKPAEAFVHALDDAPPALNSVLFRTEAQHQVEFAQVVATDTVFPGGTYQMGNASHTLELPAAAAALPARNTRPEARWCVAASLVS